MSLLDAYARFMLGSRGTDSRRPPSVEEEPPHPPPADDEARWCGCGNHRLEGSRVLCPVCEGGA